jgi:vesicle coat complex subunit
LQIAKCKLQIVTSWFAVHAIALAILLVAGCGEDRLITLRGDLQSTDPEVRRQALRELGTMGEAAGPAVTEIAALVRDPAPAVRQAACRALGDIGQSATAHVADLEAALADEAWPVRLAAAFAILKLEPKSDAPHAALNEAMAKGEGGTIVAIGQLGEDAAWAVPTLIALLNDRRPGTRRLAAEALGTIGPAASAARSSLESATRDSDDRVRAAAEQALERIHESPVTPG